MTRYGVIDVGSNTIRLVVYEVADDPAPAAGKPPFHSLINDKVMASLAAYVTDGRFTDAGVERAVRVVGGHLRRAESLGCVRVDAFATAVLRNARNGKEAVKEISRRLDHPLVLLGGDEEARLGFVGASANRARRDGVLIDIGGGSTEISRIAEGKLVRTESIKTGSLTLYESCVEGVLPTPTEAQAIGSAFKEALGEVKGLDEFACRQGFGIGGSVRAAAKLISTAARPKGLADSDVDAILMRFYADPGSFAHIAVKSVPERMHTVVPGCIVLSTLMGRLGIRELDVCKYGIREGYLIERMLKK